MNYIIRRGRYLVMLCVVIALDRFAKLWALHALQNGAHEVCAGIRFDLVLNRGITWGMLWFQSTVGFAALTACIMGVTLILAWYAWQEIEHGKPGMPYVFMLGGALSNVYDRWVYGGVIDFIELYIGRFSWPTFNLADTFLVLGVLGLAAQLFEPYSHYNNKNSDN